MNTTEKLQAIRAKCVEFLAIAEKRTPGEWSAGTLTEQHMVYDSKLRHIARLSGLGLAPENALFIASCAGAGVNDDDEIFYIDTGNYPDAAHLDVHVEERDGVREFTASAT